MHEDSELPDYKKLYRQEVKDGAIYLHLKDPSMKMEKRMEIAATLPAKLHTPRMLEEDE